VLAPCEVPNLAVRFFERQQVGRALVVLGVHRVVEAWIDYTVPW
jgi:hypothetical protein